jgi:hypothetical protein
MKLKAFSLPVGLDKHEDEVLRLTYKALRKSHSVGMSRIMIIALIQIEVTK